MPYVLVVDDAALRNNVLLGCLSSIDIEPCCRCLGTLTHGCTIGTIRVHTLP